MENETTKCPMCGTKLKMMNGRMTCKKCGYYIRSQSEAADPYSSGAYNAAGPSGPAASYGSASQNANTGQAGSSWQSGSAASSAGQTASSWQSGAPNRSGGAWQGTSPTGSSGKKPGESNPAAAIATAVILGVVCVSVLTAIVLFRAGFFDSLRTDGSPYGSAGSGRATESVSRDNSGSSSRSEASSSASSEENASDGAESHARFPRSDFFRVVSENIWGKAYRTITAEEYASLTALQINRDEKSVYYQLNYGETLFFSYVSDTGMDLADLSSFPGLVWLSVDDDLDQGDLKGLDSLFGVYSENSLQELAKIIPHPENITELGAEDGLFEKDLSGTKSFPNLEYLYVEHYFLEDISALTQFPNLQGLALVGCDRLTDYSPLMSLTSLRELNIESSQLKTIDFVRQMPDLTTLTVKGTQISNVDALEACPNLTGLTLFDNYMVEDYSVISGLTELYDLTLEVRYGNDMPSLANLTQLQTLSLKNVGDLSPLREITAPNLTYLSLENCSGWEIDAVASLQGLNTLIINDFSSYVDSLEPLTRLPNLAYLILDETSVFGNIEELFGIPTLRCLSLNDCQVGMDFAGIPDNETLELLSLSNIHILSDPTYNNGGTISLSEHYDLFDHFPNLTELDAASLQLDSLEFVEKLPKLQYLDITDNNITSLKPLEALPDFRAVWCNRNSILENLPESSNILVITDDR